MVAATGGSEEVEHDADVSSDETVEPAAFFVAAAVLRMVADVVPAFADFQPPVVQ